MEFFAKIFFLSFCLGCALAGQCENKGGTCTIILYPCSSQHTNVGSSDCGFIYKCCVPKALTTAKPNEGTTTSGVTFPPGECGQSNVVQPLSQKIVGGTVAVKNAWPWQISIHSDGWLSSGHFCGGTLINNQWVATAAHCLQDTSASDVKVVLGAHHIKGNQGGEVHMKVSKLTVHPEFNSRTLKNDIALMKLRSPVAFSSRIQAACLPNVNDTFTGDLCTSTGWGSTKEGGRVATYLQQVGLPIVSNKACTKKMNNIHDSVVCAGYLAGGKDGCQGDSGGPLVCKKKGNWQLVGIVSWGVGCARPDKYGVYTRVTSFDQWIAKEMTL